MEQSQSVDLVNSPPAAQPEWPTDPARCAITVVIQMLPDDGHAEGRPVLIGAGVAWDAAPILRMTRLGALEPLPEPLRDLLAQLERELPERAARKAAQAAEAAAAQARPRLRASGPCPLPTPRGRRREAGKASIRRLRQRTAR